MKNKTIYFHIGAHKTGTTALQKFFVYNKGILKEKGLYYDFYNNSEMNQGYLVNPEKWKTLRLDESKNYIISGEKFYHRILDISNTVKENLSNFNIHFIIYLKRQDLMKQSVYNQIVKMHGFTKEIEEDKHYNLDYYRFLQRLKNRFPEAALTVRAYEKSQFDGGSIFSDFLKILGLELTEEFQIEKKVINPSLATEKMEFTRYINMLGLPVGFRTQLSNLIIESALNSNEVSLFRDQNLISPQEAKKLLGKYNERNQAIAKEFLGRADGQLFYEEIKEDPDWKPFPGLTVKVAHGILQKMIDLDKNLLEKLYQAIITKSEKTEDFIRAANFFTPLLIEALDKKFNFQPYTLGVANSDNPFKNLKETLDSKQDSADVLREVAVAFEKLGDIQSAYTIMKQSHLLRPQGPIIKQKLDNYLKKLNEVATSS
jgi:hypothetical protein